MVKKAAFILGPALIVLAVLAASRLPEAWAPKCAFYAFTGYYCAGCGGTRAAVSLLHGDIGGALRLNALLVLLLPFALYFYAAGFTRVVLNKKILPVPKKISAWLWSLLGLVLFFMVIRNIDIFPFTLLKP